MSGLCGHSTYLTTYHWVAYGMARINNGHQNDICHSEIGLCAQKIDIILDSLNWTHLEKLTWPLEEGKSVPHIDLLQLLNIDDVFSLWNTQALKTWYFILLFKSCSLCNQIQSLRWRCIMTHVVLPFAIFKHADGCLSGSCIPWFSGHVPSNPKMLSPILGDSQLLKKWEQFPNHSNHHGLYVKLKVPTIGWHEPHEYDTKW